MSPEYARCVDDATVALLEATSWQDPRDYLADCPACGLPFWVAGRRSGPAQRYCSTACRVRAYYWSNPAYRARETARRAAARRAG